MSDIASIRTSFESCKDLQDCSFARDSRGAYVSARTRGAWAAWQACTASTSLQAPVREVPGYKLVPVAITEAMHVAAVKAIIRSTGNDDCPPNVWRAMLAAAPLPASPVQQEGE